MREMKSAKGFSLIEVLVTMSITVILVASVYFSFSNILVGRSKIKDIMSREREIYFTLDLIRGDIRNAFLSLNSGVPEETHKTIFKAEEDSPVTHLTFASINKVRMQSDVKQCDQAEIEYYGESEDGENVFYRRESFWVDEFPERGGNVYPVFKGFKRLVFEFWDEVNNEWKPVWDTESADNLNILPPKIKITMEVEDSNYDKPPYMIETVVNVKMNKPLSF
jgi:type II secretion system protein J